MNLCILSIKLRRRGGVIRILVDDKFSTLNIIGPSGIGCFVSGPLHGGDVLIYPIHGLGYIPRLHMGRRRVVCVCFSQRYEYMLSLKF